MKPSEVKFAFSVSAIDRVCAFRLRAGDGWELWLYSESHALPSNQLENARGQMRVFASLDSLHRYVRQMGYTGRIEVDG